MHRTNHCPDFVPHFTDFSRQFTDFIIFLNTRRTIPEVPGCNELHFLHHDLQWPQNTPDNSSNDQGNQQNQHKGYTRHHLQRCFGRSEELILISNRGHAPASIFDWIIKCNDWTAIRQNETIHAFLSRFHLFPQLLQARITFFTNFLLHHDTFIRMHDIGSVLCHKQTIAALTKFQLLHAPGYSIDINGSQNHTDILSIIILDQRNRVHNRFPCRLRNNRRCHKRSLFPAHRLLIPGLFLILHNLEACSGLTVQGTRAIKRSPAHTVVNIRITLPHELQTIRIVFICCSRIMLYIAQSRIRCSKLRLQHSRIEPGLNEISCILTASLGIGNELFLNRHIHITIRCSGKHNQPKNNHRQHKQQDFSLYRTNIHFTSHLLTFRFFSLFTIKILHIHVNFVIRLDFPAKKTTKK